MIFLVLIIVKGVGHLQIILFIAKAEIVFQMMIAVKLKLCLMCQTLQHSN